MTVHFVGAGPGAADLITLRGARLIERCPVCLYAGSLVPAEIVAMAPADAVVMDTAAMTLDEIVAEMVAADGAGKDVARVHSGDPSLYGATHEQMRRLEQVGINYSVTPGVPAFAAAAAAMKQELTIPGVSQSVILTRTAMQSSAMPGKEDLATLASAGTTLIIHLSVRNSRRVVAELMPFYGAQCPVVLAYRVSWPDEQILTTTLQELPQQIRAAKITRTALIMVGPVFADRAGDQESALYHEAHQHLFRNRKTRS